MTSRVARALAAGGSLLLAGCPLPLPRTEARSAPLAGTVLREDGTPLRDAEVVVATRESGPSCTEPAVRSRTDDRGGFALAGTQHTYKVTWFVPNLDVVAPRFFLCVGVRDTLRPAYVGIGSLGPEAQPDTVHCVEWEWESRARVSCSGRAARDVVTGGRWQDSAAVGFFRVFLTEEKTRVKGYDKDAPQERPFLYVQWVERLDGESGGAPYRVRATTSLDFDRNKVWSARDVILWRREGRWVVSLQGFKHAFMDDMARAELVFELGPPGQAKLVAGP